MSEVSNEEPQEWFSSLLVDEDAGRESPVNDIDDLLFGHRFYDGFRQQRHFAQPSVDQTKITLVIGLELKRQFIAAFQRPRVLERAVRLIEVDGVFVFAVVRSRTAN